MLANFASDPEHSRGRLYKETPSLYRNAFQRDRDRIVHSKAFRRLEYKTQVFVNHEGDHYRNRLTHSIEVSIIARSIARALNLSEDLAESIALAHDLGHAPFGHAGEDALKASMKAYDGFCHNAHGIKILTQLEQRYAAYNGLNLSWEVIEGIAKHNGPIRDNIPYSISEFNKVMDLDLSNYSSAESQLASLADDITYIVHDLEDGIRSDMLTLADLQSIATLDSFSDQILQCHPDIELSVLVSELGRQLTHLLVEDLLFVSRQKIKSYNIVTIDDIRQNHSAVIDFSNEIKILIGDLKSLLFKKVYRNHKVVAITLKCKRILKELFELYFESTALLPEKWEKKIEGVEDSAKAVIISDYISGMTDRYAIKEYQSFFNISFKTI